jgi:hypothetical protein
VGDDRGREEEEEEDWWEDVEKQEKTSGEGEREQK